jgi:excisionase family DNA binding protein
VKRPLPQPVPLLMLTPEQACDAMQIGRDQLEEWMHRAGFPVIRDGRVVRIPVDELRQWCAEQAALTNLRPADPVQLARLPMRKHTSPGGSPA